jgi:hypothetical protein
MDDTRIAELLESLETEDPVDATETAERLAELLAERLEESRRF